MSSNPYDKILSGAFTKDDTSPYDSILSGAFEPPKTKSPYDDIITGAAQAHNLDPDFIRATMRQESTFKPKATSNKGAAGLMQLMPETAKSLGVKNIYDPKENIYGGAKYLKQQLDRFGGDVPKALAAYNAGPGAVIKYKGIPPYKETQDYVKRITGNYRGAGYAQADPYADILSGAFDTPQQPQPPTNPANVMAQPQALPPTQIAPQPTQIEGMAPIEAPNAYPQGMPQEPPQVAPQAVTPPVQQNTPTAPVNAQKQAVSPTFATSGPTISDVNYDEQGNIIPDLTQRSNLRNAQVSAKDAGTTIADQIDIPDNIKTADKANDYVKSYLQAKYPTADFSGFKWIDHYTPGQGAVIDFNSLKKAGVDTDSILAQKVAENRIENPKPNLSPVPMDSLIDPDKASANIKEAFEGLPGGDYAAALGGGFIGGVGGLDSTMAGLLTLVNDISPTKGQSIPESLLQGGIKDVDGNPVPIQKVREDSVITALRDFGDAAQQTQNKTRILDANGEETLPSMLVQIAGRTPGDLAKLGVMSMLPGGIVTAMALDSVALERLHTSDPTKLLTAAGKGAALGALFGAAGKVGKIATDVTGTVLNKAISPLFTKGAEVATIGGGSYALSRSFGDSTKDSLQSAFVNSVFHLIGSSGKSSEGKTFRATDEQGNVIAAKVEDGKLIAVDPKEPVNVEMYVPSKATKTETTLKPIDTKAEDAPLTQRGEDRRKHASSDHVENERRSAERRVKDETLSTISPEQVLNLAGDKKINDATLDATIEKVTGKKSLMDLSKQELLDVSEELKNVKAAPIEDVPIKDAEKGFEMKSVDTAEITDNKGNPDYDKITDVAKRIERGESTLGRLNPEVERGRVAGGRRNVEASLVLAADERANQKASASDGSGMDSHSNTIKRQERVLERYAKREGIWYDHNKFFHDKDVIGRGGEAFVYQQSPNSVVKTIDFRHIDKGMTPQRFLDNRISLFNYLFPESSYTLKGMTRDANGKLRFIVEQPFIHGDALKTQADIDALMSAKGFTRSGRDSYSNSLYQVHDLHVGNVMKDARGTVYVIDAVPKALHSTEAFKESAAPEKGFEIKPAEAETSANSSLDSSASAEAISENAKRKNEGVESVVKVDTRNGKETPIIGPRPEDTPIKPYETIEFRGGKRNGEILIQGDKIAPNYSPPSRLEGETIKPKQVESIETPDTHEIKDEGASLDDWLKEYGDEPLTKRVEQGESPLKLAREVIDNEPRTESVNANERIPEARPNSESGTGDKAIAPEAVKPASEAVSGQVNTERVTAEKPVEKGGTNGGELNEKGVQSPVAETPKELELFKNNKIVTADRVAQIRAEIAKRQGKLTSGIDPVDLALYTELGAAYVEAGARKFADFSKQMIDDLGDEVRPHLDKIYGNVRKHFDFDGMTPDTRTPLEEGKGIVKVGKSIQQKAIEQGLVDEFSDTARYDIKGVEEQAKKVSDLVTSDQPRALRIIRGEEQLPDSINRSMFIDGVERYVKGMDDTVAAGKIISDLMNSDLVTDTSKAAQTLRFLQEREPDSVTAYLKQIQDARKEAAKRQGVSSEDVKTLDNRINELEKQLAEKQKASIDKQFEQFIKEVKSDQTTAKKKGGSVVDYFNELEAKAKARIEKRGEQAIFRSSVNPIDPQMLADHAIIGAAHIARGVKRGVEFTDAMVKQFGEKIHPYLDDLWDASDAFYKANVKGELTPEQIVAASDGVDRKLINSLVSARVKQGDTSVDNVFTAVTKDIQSKYPEISEREIRDTFTGYGESKEPTRNDLLRQRNVVRRLAKLQSELEDVRDGKAPWKAERQGQTKSEYVLAKERELEEAMAKAGIPLRAVKSDAERLAMRKKAMQNELKKIERNLANGNFAKPERRSIPLDPEAANIQKELVRAREARNNLGYTTSPEEAETLLHLLKAVDEGRAAMAAGGDPKTTYGVAQVALNNFVNNLKLEAKRYKMADFKANPAGFVAHLLNEAASNTKAIAASMDDSAVFRQGWKVMFTNPAIWAKNGVKTFQHLIKMRGQHEVMDALNADIVSRPTYDLMKKAKLDIGVNEETFPTTLPEHIPILGRVYKATENAYTAFVRKTRADVFDKYIDVANKTGVELTDTELKAIGRMVNSLTGRGDLGTLEQAGKVVNNVFFSPKFLKSHFDVLGGHIITGGGEGSNFVRKQAAINMIKVVGGTAAILAIAKAINPDAVDLDPRSSDFGKIRVGNTTFDVSGGMGSILTLAARMVLSQTKSSVTGKIYQLGETDKNGKLKFGAQTRFDVFLNFFTNKLSPLAGAMRDYYKGQTFDNENPTMLRLGQGLLTPLPVKTAQELWQDPNSAPFLVGLLADFMGISTNTYGGSKGVLRDMQKAKIRGDQKEVERLKPILQEELKIEAEKLKRKKAELGNK